MEKKIEKVNAKVVFVDTKNYDKNSKIILVLDKVIPIYKEKKEEKMVGGVLELVGTGVYEKTETNELDLYSSALTAEICRCNKLLGRYRATNGGKFSAEQFGLLQEAKVEVTFYEVEKDEVYEENGKTETADRNKIIKHVTKCEIDPFYEEMLPGIIRERMLGKLR